MAEKLGIRSDLVRVLLGVINMQTSFMHPPFGFALFYLRSVAPVKGTDRITKKLAAGNHHADFGTVVRANSDCHGRI